MIRGTITFYPETGLAPVAVTIGVAEDMKAPRDLKALADAGWDANDNFAAVYKAFLAGRRQGDIAVDVKFTDWLDKVQDVDLRPSRKQIEQAVALGQMTEEDGEKLIALYEDDQGEALAPPA